MKIVSMTPIKLNNVRLPGKNVMPLAGKPLAFYETTKKAFAIVHTGETRTYGNVILYKGVIPCSAREKGKA